VVVASTHREQFITDVVDASGTFSRDGAQFAVPVWDLSGRGRESGIAIYDVVDDAHSLLSFRHRMNWPGELLPRGNVRGNAPAAVTSMSFSPSGATLAVATLAPRAGVLFFDVITQGIRGWSQIWDDQIAELRYSPDGRFVVATGASNERGGDIYVFNEQGDRVWNRTAADGYQTPSPDDDLEAAPFPYTPTTPIDTMAFSADSTTMACTSSFTPEAYIYVIKVESSETYQLNTTCNVVTLVFDRSGQWLVTAEAWKPSICVLDIVSGDKLYETALDNIFYIEATSWSEDYNDHD